MRRFAALRDAWRAALSETFKSATVVRKSPSRHGTVYFLRSDEPDRRPAPGTVPCYFGPTGIRSLRCAIHNQQLFDHLGGAQQHRWGYGKAEPLGGLAVHDH